MKVRIRDRVFVTLAGILLIAAAAALTAQAFFRVEIAQWAAGFVAKRDLKHLAVTVGAIAILVLLGLYCFLMLFRRSRKKNAFVVQETDTGELSISMKALENLVQKCVDKHDELHVVSTSLWNTRYGLVIRLRIALSNGVNIPLVVSTLQKQITQYVTACSGVDVREVRVQVDTASGKLKDEAYAVPEGEVITPERPEIPAEEKTEVVEEERRPLHQRLFSPGEQPAVMPEAPAEAGPAAEAKIAAEETPEAEPEASAPVMEPDETEAHAEDEEKTEVATDGE